MSIIIIIIIIALLHSYQKKEKERIKQNIEEYEKSDYYNQTQNSYQYINSDIGARGEYLIYKYLTNIPGYKRFLFNCYIPKDVYGHTTEIDVIMIHETGIYVYESKNYKGWIFGDVNQRTWTQTLRSSSGIQKNHFYNPIMQNETHIKWLAQYLNWQNTKIFHSYIIFGDETILKTHIPNSEEYTIITRNNLIEKTMDKIVYAKKVLDIETIDRLYQKLYCTTQVSEAVKNQHIQDTLKYYKAVNR